MKTTKEKIAVMQAFDDKRPIDVWTYGEKKWDRWRSSVEPVWDWVNNDYRIAHEPKLRPWTIDEVPLNALFKSEGGNIYRIGSVIDGKPQFCGYEQYSESFIRNNLKYTHSIDGGKTWHPCGIEE